MSRPCRFRAKRAPPRPTLSRPQHFVLFGGLHILLTICLCYRVVHASSTGSASCTNPCGMQPSTWLLNYIHRFAFFAPGQSFDAI
ncbi:uncharacterized protein K460DRAFT_32109 [Cucurbitaria berberidis CBS 394.84]|uniref:Uncharacterized protein n=1 Tax=Cucurbitaria berberidis CBS 394.84 TaxID=1168544 RepID=A0A9P4GTB3_9PLEO|nr:uncharacterized protein K460DRAFT_32109 [Cucurbitaria berberidis CBS 394.84]KAF1851355.1 hypothetical protein K460DRAFT_32109 [Cucurbitaria berberidis CBS 394.84]